MVVVADDGPNQQRREGEGRGVDQQGAAGGEKDEERPGASVAADLGDLGGDAHE
jgi:hypothetical protein